jgi:hypothetical protein
VVAPPPPLSVHTPPHVLSLTSSTQQRDGARRRLRKGDR